MNKSLQLIAVRIFPLLFVCTPVSYTVVYQYQLQDQPFHNFRAGDR